MGNTFHRTIISPLGPLSMTEGAGRIIHLDWHGSDREASALEIEALTQLQAYFDGRLTCFDLPLDFGTGLHDKIC